MWDDFYWCARGSRSRKYSGITFVLSRVTLSDGKYAWHRFNFDVERATRTIEHDRLLFRLNISSSMQQRLINTVHTGQSPRYVNKFMSTCWTDEFGNVENCRFFSWPFFRCYMLIYECYCINIRLIFCFVKLFEETKKERMRKIGQHCSNCKYVIISLPEFYVSRDRNY